MTITWPRDVLKRLYPDADFQKGADLNNDGVIEDQEKLVDSNNNQIVGDDEDWQAYYLKNKAGLVGAHDYFKWASIFRDENPIHGVLAIEGRKMPEEDIIKAYSVLSDLINRVRIYTQNEREEFLARFKDKAPSQQDFHNLFLKYADIAGRAIDESITGDKIDSDESILLTEDIIFRQMSSESYLELLLFIGREMGWPMQLRRFAGNDDKGMYIAWDNGAITRFITGARLNVLPDFMPLDAKGARITDIGDAGAYVFALSDLINREWWWAVEKKIQYYAEAIKLFPTNAEYHNKLGGLLYGQEKYPEAENSFRQSVRLNPNIAEYHYNLGAVLEDQKKYAGAEESFLKAGRLDPANAEYCYHLGNALFKQGKLQEATASYEKPAKSIDPANAEYHFKLGNFLKEVKKFSDAEKSYREAIRLDPNNAEYFYYLGDVLSYQGKTEEAIASYKEPSKRIDPNKAEYHAQLGYLLSRLEKYAEAEKSYRVAERLDPKNAHYCYSLGDVLFLQGKLKQAIASYEEPIKSIDPNNAEYHNKLGNFYFFYCRKYAEAEKSYMEAIRLEPGNADYKVNLGDALFRQGKLREAEKNYQEAIALKPDNVSAHTQLGFIQYKLGRLDDAYSNFDYATAVGRDWILSSYQSLSHYMKGIILLKTGGKEEAAESFERAANIDYTIDDIVFHLLALVRIGKSEEARKELQMIDSRIYDAIYPIYKEWFDELKKELNLRRDKQMTL